jgi:hypothetical protein
MSYLCATAFNILLHVPHNFCTMGTNLGLG